MNYQVHLIPVNKIFVDEDLNDARGKILPVDVVDLAKDIAKSGLQQPLHVQATDKRSPYEYRCVAGNRRLTALRLNKAETAPCFLVDPNVSELAVRAINLKENLLRKDLDIVQEAIAIKPYVVAHWTEETIANEFEQSRGWVQIRKIILGLPKDIQEELRAGLLNQSQIRKLGSMSNDADKYAFIRQAKEHASKGEKMTVKEPPKPINPEARKERKPEQIYSMIEYMIGLFGESSLTTRALAWAAGSVSDLELGDDIRQFCEANGKDYEPHEAIEDLVS